jgi:hypothetical protein
MKGKTIVGGRGGIEGHTRTGTKQQRACHKTFSQSECAVHAQNKTAKHKLKVYGNFVFNYIT